jgi:formate dehydrogenase (NADP+) beta subunit
VKLFYRRTRNEMPAYPDEVDAAIDEGVKIEFLASPAMIKRQGDGLQVLFDRMELGPPDRDGRPRPIPKSGCGFGVVVDTVISAIGQAVSLEGSFGVPLDGKGLIPVTGGSPGGICGRRCGQRALVDHRGHF